MSSGRKPRQAEQRDEKAFHEVAEHRTTVLGAKAGKLQLTRGAGHGRMAAHSKPDPHDRASFGKGRTGIVSVNGRDVGEMRCTGGRRSA